MHEAKSQLSRLVEAACHGEEVILSRNGVPLVRLQPIEQPQAKRELGLARGQFTMSPDFDHPMGEAELDEFLG